MRPVIDTLKQQLDDVKSVLDRNRASQQSLQRDEARLLKQRDDLQAAVDFIKARQG